MIFCRFLVFFLWHKHDQYVLSKEVISLRRHWRVSRSGYRMAELFRPLNDTSRSINAYDLGKFNIANLNIYIYIYSHKFYAIL